MPLVLPRHGLGALGQVPSLSKAMASVAGRQIKGVVFRSAISPEVRLDPHQKTPRTRSQGGFSESFLRFAKPALYVETSLGVMKVAPWGEPRTNWFPLLAGGAVILGAVGMGLMIRGLRRRR